MIDNVSETTRLPWPEVYRMNIYEFFNIYHYLIEKGRRRQAEYDKINNRIRY